MLVSNIGCGAGKHIDNGIVANVNAIQNSAAATENKVHEVHDADLRFQLEKWKKRSIADYDMVIECFCGNGIGGPAGSVLVKVRSGETRSIVSVTGGDTRETRTYENVSTVEKMFGYVQELRDRRANSADESNNSRTGFPEISTEYDHEYGYPRTIRIVWAPAADGASLFTVKDFKPSSSVETNR